MSVPEKAPVKIVPDSLINATVNRKALLEELAIFKTMMSTRASIPVLNQIQLTTVGDRLKIFASDLDDYFESSIAAEVQVKGSVIVGFSRLFDLVSANSSDKITLERVLEKDIDSFKVGSMKLMSWTQEWIDWPKEALETEIVATLETGDLKQALKQTAISAVADSSRYALRAANIESSAGILRIVATDGHRLSLVELPLEEGAAEFTGLLRQSGIKILFKALEPYSWAKNVPTEREKYTTVIALDSNKDKDVNDGKRGFIITQGNRTLYSKPQAGQFPNWKLIMPEESEYKALLSVKPLQKLLKQVKTAVGKTQEKALFLFFDAENKVLTIGAYDLAHQPIVFETEYEPLDTPSFFVCLNREYLNEFLTVCGETQVVLEAISYNSTLVFSGFVTSQFKYVVMPIRADEPEKVVGEGVTPVLLAMEKRDKARDKEREKAAKAAAPKKEKKPRAKKGA